MGSTNSLLWMEGPRLVNHVVGEDRWTKPLLDGRTIAEVGSSLDGDLLGTAPLEVADAAAEEALEAAAEKLPAGGKVHLSYGEEDMGEYIWQLAADHLIHAWDLAAATDGDTELDDDWSTRSRPGSPTERILPDGRRIGPRGREADCAGTPAVRIRTGRTVGCQSCCAGSVLGRVRTPAMSRERWRCRPMTCLRVDQPGARWPAL